MDVNCVVRDWMSLSEQTHKAYFRLLDDWADLYLDSIRIRERMRKKQVQVEYGWDEVVYLGEKIPRWMRVEIALNDLRIQRYFEGIANHLLCLDRFLDGGGNL